MPVVTIPVGDGAPTGMSQNLTCGAFQVQFDLCENQNLTASGRYCPGRGDSGGNRLTVCRNNDAEGLLNRRHIVDHLFAYDFHQFFHSQTVWYLFNI